MRTLCLGLMLCSLCGCSLWKSSTEAMRASMRPFTPRLTDYRDMTQEEEDEWGHVGEIARGDRPIERDPDPLGSLFRSPKAMNIERNLGVGY